MLYLFFHSLSKWLLISLQAFVCIVPAHLILLSLLPCFVTISIVKYHFLLCTFIFVLRPLFLPILDFFNKREEPGVDSSHFAGVLVLCFYFIGVFVYRFIVSATR